MVLEIPSGWTAAGEGLGGDCTGLCGAVDEVASGESRNMQMDIQPNQPGSFTIQTQLEWYHGGESINVSAKNLSMPISVTPRHPHLCRLLRPRRRLDRRRSLRRRLRRPLLPRPAPTVNPLGCGIDEPCVRVLIPTRPRST